MPSSTFLIAMVLGIGLSGIVLAASELDRVLASRPERIATGFQFTEGPVYSPECGLLFSDIPGNRIHQWRPDEAVTVFRSPSGHSNGLTYDRQGGLIACEHGARRVSRTEEDGRVVALASRYQGKRLNSPNDVVVKSGGTVYFTDPPYGVKPAERELSFQGVYRIGSDGALTLLVRDFDKPNGLAFSPDESVLYVDDSARKHVRAFEVRPDGTLANGRVFADMQSDAPGSPDGMKVDVEGRLYVTGPGGTWVFDKTGRHLGTIVTPETPSNCAFGGEGNRTLFITARTSVYRVRLNVEGIGPR